METGYCPGCFQKRNEGELNRLCSKCGFDPAVNQQPQNALPWYTRLNNRYLVGYVLGQGGFGITYIGFDTNLERKVAIKEYYPRGVVVRDASQSHSLTWPTGQNTQQKESGCESFLREARKMAKIDSIPGIVRVIDTFTENDTAYIVMDYLEGVTLRKYILANGPMTFTRCMEMLRPLFGAIDEMHRKSMIHRDISPDNIMIRDNGTVWLLDFGAAKDMAGAVGGEASAVVARSGFSPLEQYGGKDIGPWTDVYALCATIYYCVSGRTLPLASERVRDDSIQWEPARVPEDIRGTIREGLSVQYDHRIQSVSDLTRRLDEVDEPPREEEEEKKEAPGEQTEVVVDSKDDDGGNISISIDPFDEETEKQKRKNFLKKVSIAAAAALILIVCAVVAFSWRGDGTPTVDNSGDSGAVESPGAVDDATEDDDTGDEAVDAVEEDDGGGGAEGGEGTDAPEEPEPPVSQITEPETFVTNRSFTDSDGDTYTYTGEVSNGKPNGTGTGVYTGGTYTGAWKDGDIDGQGTFTYTSGSKYEGEWKDGKKDGTGTYTFVGGDKYEGEFKDNNYNGTGTYTYADGSKYVGEWKDDKKDGTGTLTLADGDKYEGEFKDGTYNGTGTYISADDSKYVGEWKDGKHHGQGTITYADGDKYEGEWKDGKKDGTGTYTEADGRKYEGEFKDDEFKGIGTYTWPNGDKYEGEWEGNRVNGTGTLTWANGRKYVGGWKDGKRNGQGVLYNADGTVDKSGSWKDDEFVSS